MRRSNKHQSQRIVFNNLIGGVNTSDAPERIPETDMQVCKNFIYDNMRLRGRGGIKPVPFTLSDDVRAIYHDTDTNILFIFLNDQSFYRWTVGQPPQYVGKVNGIKTPMCAKYMDKLWIASGGQLQSYDYTRLQTITSSPNCDICYQRLSRLLISLTGSDRVYFSAIGDPTDWTNITDSAKGTVASSAQWIDIGYGDSGDIESIVPLANDLIFFKSNGNVYQLQSDREPTSWVVPPAIVTGSDSIGKHTATNIGAGVVFLSRRGLKSLETVMDYGNIKPQDIGDKFRSLITNDMWEPEIVNMRRHGWLMIRTTSNKRKWVCYNYLLNAATTIEFSVEIEGIIETVGEVYVYSGNRIYLWDAENIDDDGVPIEFELKPRDIISSDEMLVKSVDTKFSDTELGTVTVTTSALSVTVPTNSRQKTRCNHSTDKISLSATGNDGFTFDHIILEVADL